MKTTKTHQLKYTKDYLLLIDEEAEININDYWIYLTSNEDFDGVVTKSNLTEKDWYSKLHDRFAYKKVTAYYPLNSEAKELDLPLLPNPFEENIEILWSDFNKNHNRNCPLSKEQFVRAINYKATQSKQFSLEDMKKAIEMAQEEYYNEGGYQGLEYEPEQIIQSLYTQKLPSEFIPEYDEIIVDKLVPKMPIDTIKTITNSEGKEELVGVYRY